MRAYISRRVLMALLTVWLVSVATFFMLRFIPGSVLEELFKDAAVSQRTKELVLHQLGLDKPAYVQYFLWMGDVFRGDFGESVLTGRPVMDRIKERIPVSLEMGIIALLISVPVGVGIGVLSAVRQNSFWDFAGRSVAIGGLSFPDFFLATLIILYASVWFNYAVPLVYAPPWKDLSRNAQQILIPAAILGFRLSASTMRITRSTVLEVLRQDYIRTAWSKGLRERVVISRHALKNALIPVITAIGGQASILLGGTVIMETVFTLPGMGRLVVESIQRYDYPQTQAVVLLLSAFIVFMNLFVDILYVFVDPRVRYG